MFQALGSWSVLGWILACFSINLDGLGAVEIEQQGLHASSSELLERPGLDSGLFFNKSQWLMGC